MITADLSIETLQGRREWQDIVKVMKENNPQPRLLFPARISFKYESKSLLKNLHFLLKLKKKWVLRMFFFLKPQLREKWSDFLAYWAWELQLWVPNILGMQSEGLFFCLFAKEKEIYHWTHSFKEYQGEIRKT